MWTVPCMYLQYRSARKPATKKVKVAARSVVGFLAQSSSLYGQRSREINPHTLPSHRLHLWAASFAMICSIGIAAAKMPHSSAFHSRRQFVQFSRCRSVAEVGRLQVFLRKLFVAAHWPMRYMHKSTSQHGPPASRSPSRINHRCSQLVFRVPANKP